MPTTNPVQTPITIKKPSFAGGGSPVTANPPSTVTPVVPIQWPAANDNMYKSDYVDQWQKQVKAPVSPVAPTSQPEQEQLVYNWVRKPTQPQWSNTKGPTQNDYMYKSDYIDKWQEQPVQQPTIDQTAIDEAQRVTKAKDTTKAGIQAMIDSAKASGTKLDQTGLEQIISNGIQQYGGTTSVNDPNSLKFQQEVKDSILKQYGVKDMAWLLGVTNAWADQLQAMSLMTPLQIWEALAKWSLDQSIFANLQKSHPELYAQATKEYQKAKKYQDANKALSSATTGAVDTAKKDTDIDGKVQQITDGKMEYVDALHKFTDTEAIKKSKVALAEKAKEIDDLENQKRTMRQSMETKYPGATKAEISWLMYDMTQGIDNQLFDLRADYNVAKAGYDADMDTAKQEFEAYKEGSKQVEELTKRTKQFTMEGQKFDRQKQQADISQARDEKKFGIQTAMQQDQIDQGKWTVTPEGYLLNTKDGTLKSPWNVNGTDSTFTDTDLNRTNPTNVWSDTNNFWNFVNGTWQGNIGTYKSPNGRTYSVFATAEDGYNALVNDLQTKVSWGSTRATPKTTVKDFVKWYTQWPNAKWDASPWYIKAFLAQNPWATADTPIWQLDTKKMALGIMSWEGTLKQYLAGGKDLSHLKASQPSLAVTKEDKVIVDQLSPIQQKMLQDDPNLLSLAKRASQWLIDPNTVIKGMWKTLQPKRDLVDAIASTQNPNYIQAIAKRKALNDTQTPNSEWSMRKSLNTAIEHTVQLKKLVDAINNSDVKQINVLVNGMKKQFGNEDIANLETMSNVAGTELAKYITWKGNFSEAEAKEMKDTLSSNYWPDVLNWSIDTLVEAMSWRYRTSQQTLDEVWLDIDYLLPEQRQLLQKYGYDKMFERTGQKSKAYSFTDKLDTPQTQWEWSVAQSPDDRRNKYMQ
jgi:hypothetical protein